jgi:hypothetical protein
MLVPNPDAIIPMAATPIPAYAGNRRKIEAKAPPGEAKSITEPVVAARTTDTIRVTQQRLKTQFFRILLTREEHPLRNDDVAKMNIVHFTDTPPCVRKELLKYD